MKSAVLFLFLAAFTFLSCAKKECPFQNKYIYEALVFDEECDCIVAGKVKYLKDCQTAALVDYGDGTCDNIATKTLCVNGKCETEAGATVEEFEFDCSETVEDGPVSAEEAEALGI